MRRLALILALLCAAALLWSCSAYASTSMTQVAAYNAADAPVPGCPDDLGGVVPIEVPDLGRDILGEVDGTRWGECAYAIRTDQSPYMACLTVFHERGHLRQWATEGRTYHTDGGLMNATLDESFYFEPCARLVPPVTVSKADAWTVVDAHWPDSINSMRCTRRTPNALRCYARSGLGKRLVLDVWTTGDRQTHVARMGRRHPLTTPLA